jgi:hypothetical protein
MTEKQIFRTAKELGAYIGASENAIHIMVARGRLPVHRHGRTLVFLKEEIDGYFAGLPGVTGAEADTIDRVWRRRRRARATAAAGPAPAPAA